jgi:hypothetical protein
MRFTYSNDIIFTAIYGFSFCQFSLEALALTGNG